jgi:hypothetical protein
MSGLPSGHFVDYLVIGVFSGAAVAILGALLHGALKRKLLAATASMAMVVLAVLGHFAVQRWMPPEPEAHIKIDFFPSPSPSPVPESDGKSSPTPALEPHKESLEERFIRENIVSPPKSARKAGQWAVVIADPDGRENYPHLASTASSVITGAGYSTVATFRPSVTHNPGFGTLFAADPALSRLMAEYCDKILVARVTSSTADNPSYPGLLSVTLTLDVKIISTRTSDVQHQFQISEVGAGLKPEESRTNAEERVAASLRSKLKESLK